MSAGLNQLRIVWEKLKHVLPLKKRMVHFPELL